MLRCALICAQQWLGTTKKAAIYRQSANKCESSKSVFFPPVRILPKRCNNSVGFTFARHLATAKFAGFTTSSDSISNGAIDVFSNNTHLNPRSWVSRSSFEEIVINNFTKNWDAFQAKSNDMRQNAYSGLIIAGGIGIGKTRAAMQIPYIVANYLNTTTGIDKIAKSTLGAIVNISLDMRRFDTRSIENTGRRPPASATDNLLAETLFLAFSNELGEKESAGTQPLVISKGLTIERLFNDIYSTTKSDSNKPLLVYLHIDEFQMAPTFCLALARFAGNYNTRNKKKGLIILVFSGLGTAALAKSVGGSNYILQHVQLKLSVKPDWLHGIANHFLKNMSSSSQIEKFKAKHPDTYIKLLATTGGIPVFVAVLLQKLARTQLDLGPTVAHIAFTAAIGELQTLYGKEDRNNLNWFANNEHLKTFVRKAFFKDPVLRQDKLNEKTIGELEESGLIYLVESREGTLRIGLPLMMLIHFDKALKLLEGLPRLTDPFQTLDEDAFEEFIAQIYTFSWRLLAGTTKVTLEKFHRMCLVGRKALLEQHIDLPADEVISTMNAENLPQTPLEPFTFTLVGVNEALHYTDASKIFVLQTKKRDSAPDIILPGRLQVQTKWSLRCADLQPIGPKRENDAAAYIDTQLITKEAAKASPQLPLILITPKLPNPHKQPLPDVAVKILPGLKNVALITGEECFKFMEPFYMYGVSEIETETTAPPGTSPQ